MERLGLKTTSMNFRFLGILVFLGLSACSSCQRSKAPQQVGPRATIERPKLEACQTDKFKGSFILYRQDIYADMNLGYLEDSHQILVFKDKTKLIHISSSSPIVLPDYQSISKKDAVINVEMDANSKISFINMLMKNRRSEFDCGFAAEDYLGSPTSKAEMVKKGDLVLMAPCPDKPNEICFLEAFRELDPGKLPKVYEHEMAD